MSNKDRSRDRLRSYNDVRNARQKNKQRHMNDQTNDIESICERFAEILDAEPDVTNGVCVASRVRDLEASIMGRETNSPLVFPQFFSFENFDDEGNTLNLGETVILQHEINSFVERLVEQNIQFTAFHNHWLFDDPRLMYVHFQSIEPPLVFARKTANALELLDG
ncbi:protein of unknown function [Virgibacillus subterraneus]|uniref:DUF1259 domain-containing protein n=2 Tax=Virgibacillus TaxID=84406 RepID=A0A1H1DT46_9BACI|nr:MULTISPECIES: DUF1259 domain-containing protein [Virgibacillus]SDQ79702.1 protein of unknown function [Virgibacillus salinus]SEQ89146.1 protein of unknown function [Virgibacillus subterraneus]